MQLIERWDPTDVLEPVPGTGSKHEKAESKSSGRSKLPYSARMASSLSSIAAVLVRLASETKKTDH